MRTLDQTRDACEQQLIPASVSPLQSGAGEMVLMRPSLASGSASSAREPTPNWRRTPAVLRLSLGCACKG